MAIFLIFMLTEIPLQIEQPLSVQSFGGRYQVLCPDGTFLILNKTTVLHFGNDGSLIRSLGRQGEGPGEFSFIYTALWDKKHYIVVDIERKISLFDNNGHFLKSIRTNGSLAKVGWTGEEIYGFYISPQPQPTPYKGLFNLTNITELATLEKLKMYHNTSNEIIRFSFNNENHWVSSNDDKQYVLDELLPLISIYDDEQKRIRSIELELPFFVPAPEKWIDRKGKTQKQVLTWFFSWSRFAGLKVKSNKILVAYQSTDDKEPTAPTTIISILDHNGKLQEKARKTKSLFIGADKNYYYLFKTIDDEEKLIPEYRIERKDW